MRSLSEIRTSFLHFFKHQGHTLVPSSPVIPQNDPTLLFTNAGMVQFKDVFTNREAKPYVRAASSQKCIRAGGKHNDLDNVGYTARHHTFFEMLGNFSFGDYFKEEAIHFAWEFLTKELNLPKEKLLVTVYAEDLESASIWKKLTGFPDHKIIKIGTTDNFWSMGDLGPCGPCTEIFYDHGDKIPGGPPGSPDEDGDRFIEIWNLVFMQFEQLPGGKRIDLPKPCVDTGMGLERIGAVLQGVHDNYDTDLFKNIIQATKDVVGDKGLRQSYNIIADHLRSCAFMVADGVMPSNEGRGYVLRRIMRRAMRHAHLLGSKDPLMTQLVSSLIDVMGTAYPELIRAQEFIEMTFKTEEEKFRETLGKGLKLLEEVKPIIKNKTLSGDIAFKLYDTYGFPLDLTQDVLRIEGIQVDTEGFDAAMLEQKQRARKAWAGSGDKAQETLYFDLKEEFGSTEFLGYLATHAEGVVQALVVDGKKVESTKSGESVEIICNQTPFYAEAGGQVGDVGFIKTDDCLIEITDCVKKVDSLFIHKGVVKQGVLNLNDKVRFDVDGLKRRRIAANHSATHLLHAALREVLGKHVVQKGSLVAPDRLRFDFTHTGPLTDEEIVKIENLVNLEIAKNYHSVTKLMTPEEAIQDGAMALFGERYADEVRVVSFSGFSTELCGGTHVSATGDIGLFKILSESSVASGVRRMEALTGLSILDYLRELKIQADTLKEDLKAQNLAFQKQITALKLQNIVASLGEMDEEIEDSNGSIWALKKLKDVAGKDLRPIVEQISKKNVVIVTSVESADKVSVIIRVSGAPQIDASVLIKKAVAHLGGQGGGGKADMAQGGGTDPSKIDTLLQSLLS